MMCEACQKGDAAVHLTQIIREKVRQINLCDKCSEERSAANPSAFSADYIAGQDPASGPLGGQAHFGST
jgi:protein-arginine kinase activator protein McsA